MSTAPAGFGDPPPHVAQRSRRDKLRFPPAADVMLPPPYDDAADLGYLHAVVAPPPPPPPAPTDHWLASQYVDASAPWARAKLLEHDEARGFTTQPAAVLSLTLSPAPQELLPAYGGSLQSVVGAAAAAARPLGPFTGYAAVLKGSRFLRPAQQLLDEICAALVGAEATSGSAGAVGGSSLASPSSLSSSTDTGDRQHQRPEFREKKAKLLYMQEEVCRRHKQYQQQMQMVSSFEPVPGQSCATPYASSVLKAISRHFRRVRSIISSQIQHTGRLLGEELLSLPSCSSGGRAAARSSGLTDQISQPVWRPQRGLPERAVSVLRAWLFDHFLHPYPTDADKHMLATQTGLSRNQVSNWFINARVRLWKPMVEEIHMLETRGSANTNASSDRSNPGAALSNHTAGPLPPLPPPVAVGGGHHVQQQQMLGQYLDAAPPPMGIQVGGGGQVMLSFGAAADMGGFGAVSLTLGLRRDVSYHQQHQQQQFGCGHILGDLVG